MGSQQQLFDEEITPEQTAAQAERDRVREEYRARLAEKLKDPEFRKIEGFPIGTDEAILALSDPPYYTACPNPFIEEWLAENGKPYDAATDTYHREPFAADVSEGKNDPIYNAHSYHTKVPHKAIMRYILHYTQPGDVVYDGFCGTGMTGVAAQMCGNKVQVESLGYRVKDDGTILDETGKPFSALGARKAILNDLSPAATFIAYNYNTPVDPKAFEREAKRILAEVEEECGWMYSTLHDASEAETKRIADAVRDCHTTEAIRDLFAELKSGHSSLKDIGGKLQIGRVNYTVWSDVFICPNCGNEFIFRDAAVEAGKVSDVFPCPTCRAEISKRNSERAFITQFDENINSTIRRTKQNPVLVNYAVGNAKFERPTNEYDLSILRAIEEFKIPFAYPSVPMMGKGEQWGDSWRAGYHSGFSHVHHFYIKRSLWILSVLANKAKVTQAARERAVLWFLFGQWVIGLSRLNRYSPHHFSQNNRNLSGTLYCGSQVAEVSPKYAFTEKIKRLTEAFKHWTSDNAFISCRSTTQALAIGQSQLDYIFTDPPFGGNLPYSELNFLWESWLGVQTHTSSEAITSVSQSKKLPDYQLLMAECFKNYYAGLKPGRWMTVEFHNSANSVWNSIQESLWNAGFIVADVRTLDKEGKTKKQISGANAVNVDLVISCYKPRTEFETRFCDIQGTPASAVEFVRQHLAMLPVTQLSKNGKIEPVAERNRFLLFDRMIAYHLQKGAPIPLDAAPFYKMLDEQFTCRDEMYFLPEQAARFDALKLQGMETEQLSIFVQDEKTAVQWVRSALAETPQTLGELTPTFMQELRDWPAHEPRPELKDLLREYFIQNENGVWRVPNPDDEKDIEQLRKNALLRLFRDYTKAKGPLKVFRKEAIIQGFTTCYETSQYGVIVSVCEKIPEKIRDEIQEFVMFYDIAKSLAPPEIVQTEFVFE